MDSPCGVILQNTSDVILLELWRAGFPSREENGGYESTRMLRHSSESKIQEKIKEQEGGTEELER